MSSAREIPADLSRSETLAGPPSAIPAADLRDLVQQVSLQAALLRDISVALVSTGSTRAMLQRCAEAVVHHLDAAFARVWTLGSSAEILELQASAGLYTHLDGPHGRVPVGSFKIGLIAQERKPHLTNQVVGDPRVGDQEWARREGMVAFAGYPLLVEDRLVGVLALFARHRLSTSTMEALGVIAQIVGAGIQRKQTEEALAESEARKSAMMDAALDCVITIDAESRILEFNPAAERTFGYTRAAVLGTSMVELIIPPAYREAHHRGLAHFLATGEGPVLDRRIELPALRADGTEFPSEVAIVALRTGGKSIFTAYLRDISEQKRAESEQEALRERERAALLAAQEAIRLRDDFLAVASHDLKNPLAALYGTAQLLQRTLARTGAIPADRLVSGLSGIVSSSEQMNRQIGDLLDVARARAGEPLTLNRKPSDLVELTRRAVTAAQQATERHQLRFVVGSGQRENPTNLDTIVGNWDRTQIERVIGNLLSNAVKYSPGGEIAVTLWPETDTACPAEWAVLTVEDHGVGIPAADLPYVFDRFARASNVVGRVGGSGIGLTAARQVVEQHGGTIAVKSEEGQGSTFTVRLPLAADAPLRDAAAGDEQAS